MGRQAKAMRNVGRKCPIPCGPDNLPEPGALRNTPIAGAFSLSRMCESAEKPSMRDLFAALMVCLCFCLSGTGCFVLDELDKGQEEMRKHSPQTKNDPAETAKAERGGESGFTFAGLRKKGAGALDDLSGVVEEAMQPTLDPENVVVRCQIDGRTEFTRKFDCQSRGGRLLNR